MPPRPHRSTWIVLALAPAYSAAPAFAQQLGQADPPDVPWWRVVGALLFCLLLAAGAAFALRHRLPQLGDLGRRTAGRMRLLESTRLTPQVDVCLLRCDDKDLLIAVSSQGATLLSIEPARPEPEIAPE